MSSEIAKQRTKLFIKKYGVDVATAINGTGLFFEAVIGQKCMESAFGDSALARGSNNFGGIKNRPPGSSGITSSGFSIFPTPFDCFRAYVATITSPNKKYVAMGVLSAISPEQQIKRMVEAGYCEGLTSAEYVSRCQNAIDAAREICPLGRITNLSASLGTITQNTG